MTESEDGARLEGAITAALLQRRHAHSIFERVFSVTVLALGTAWWLVPPGWVVLPDRATAFKADASAIVMRLAGTLALLGRTGWRIDRSRRTLRTWWGLLVPLLWTTRDLQIFRAVGYAPDTRGAKASLVYEVRGRTRHLSLTPFDVKSTGYDGRASDKVLAAVSFQPSAFSENTRFRGAEH